MGKVVREMGLTGPDWICEKEFYFVDPDTGERHVRRLDAYNKRSREIVEVKSNGSPDGREKPADRAWAKNPGWRSYRYTYVFAENQTRDAKNFMKELKTTAGRTPSAGTGSGPTTTSPTTRDCRPRAPRTGPTARTARRCRRATAPRPARAAPATR